MNIIEKFLESSPRLRKWSEKHLNWTYILGVILFLFLFQLLYFFLTENLWWMYFVLILAQLVLVLSLAEWVLVRKNQNPWILLTILIAGIGHIIILALPTAKVSRKSEKKRWYQQWWVWLLIVVVFFILLMTIAGILAFWSASFVS